MTKQLQTTGNRSRLQIRGDDSINTSDTNITQFSAPFTALNPFLSFNYVWIEISLSSGEACVKSRRTRFQNGKLISEQFDGTVDERVYKHMISDAQNHFIDQWISLMKSFSLFFSVTGKERAHDD